MRTLICLVALTVLSGCWNKKGSEKPAELTKIENAVSVGQLWSTSLDMSVEVGFQLEPAVENDIVYASGSSGDVGAWRLENGERLWIADLDVDISSGPGVADGLLAVGTVEGGVIVLSADSGEELWRATVSSEVLTAPLIHNGVVAVRVQDGRLFGFSAVSGTREWIFDQGIPLLTLRGNGPMIARGGVLYLGYDNGKVFALDVQSGRVIWEQVVSDPQGRTELGRLSDVDGKLALVGSELHAIGYQGRVVSMAADSGRVLWTQDHSSYHGVAVDRSDLAFSTSSSEVYVLDRLSGSTKWQSDSLRNRFVTGPAILSQFVAVADFEGYLHLFDRDTGVLVGRRKFSGDSITAQPIAVRDFLVLMDTSGKLGVLAL